MGHEVEKINANTDEREFINRLKAGDRGAFEQFVLENQRLVFSYCLSRLPSREDAEDVAQESFLRAFKSISSFRAEASLRSWLIAISKNLCSDFYRKKKIDSFSFDAFMEEGGDLPSESLSPFETLESSETRKLISKAIDNLPDEFKEAFLLRENFDLSYAEIAKVLGVREGTVKSRISRARGFIKSELIKSGNFDEFISSND